MKRRCRRHSDRKRPDPMRSELHIRATFLSSGNIFTWLDDGWFRCRFSVVRLEAKSISKQNYKTDFGRRKLNGRKTPSRLVPQFIIIKCGISPFVLWFSVSPLFLSRSLEFSLLLFNYSIPRSLRNHNSFFPENEVERAIRINWLVLLEGGLSHWATGTLSNWHTKELTHLLINL